MIPLPGHFFDMVGFRTKDDVVYLADCLSGKETLDKYQIGFLYDVAAYLDTLERVKEMQAALFVPAHAAETKEIAPLAQYNIDKVLEIAENIVGICREPICFEKILQRLFRDYGQQYKETRLKLVGEHYVEWEDSDSWRDRKYCRLQGGKPGESAEKAACRCACDHDKECNGVYHSGRI